MVKRLRVHGWMPWSYPAKKGVVSCENHGGEANILRSRASRMGLTRLFNNSHCAVNTYAVQSETQGTEPSKYLKEKKSIEIPLVAASERGLAQTIYISVCMGL